MKRVESVEISEAGLLLLTRDKGRYFIQGEILEVEGDILDLWRAMVDDVYYGDDDSITFITDKGDVYFRFNDKPYMEEL